MIRRVFAVLLSLFLIAGPTLSSATDFTHTSWTELDGAPSGATRFAQGPDGWLWIATPAGLYRFDGVRFERRDTVYGHALESSNLMGLAATADGALWVGNRVGGVTVFRPDGARSYGEPEGLPPTGVLHIEAAPDGAIWVAMRDGVAVLAPGASRFVHLGGEAGLPTQGVFQILFARDGVTWIGANSGAYFRRPGQARFAQAWPRKPLVWLAEGPDGAIWGNDFAQGYYRVAMSALASDAPVLQGRAMLFDREGAMWMVHTDSIERKLAQGDVREKLSGPLVGALFLDREGNIWLSTSRGIDRLRPNRLRTLPAEQALEYPALVAAPSGAMWVGDYASDTWEYGPAGRLRQQVPGKITASYTAPDGVVWLGGMDGVLRRATDGSISTLPLPAELKSLRVHALQQDRDGVLWVAMAGGKGVFRIVDGQWRKAAGLPELLTTTMTLDHAGKLWLAHLRNQISIVDGDQVRRLGAGQGLRLGTVLALQPDGAAMWAGGEHGVALYRDGQFSALRGSRGEAFRGVSGIVRLPDGDLWLHGAEGLYHIRAAALQAWWRDSRREVAFERFNAHDGMQGHAPQLRPVPSLRRAADGLLWYATTSSVGTIDPARILRNTLAPPVEVLGVQANGQHYPARAGQVVSLPQGTRHLQIDFTALSLAMPERVQLRYRLNGVDADWQTPASGRQASYTNLEPGAYRFEVSAANEDGLWNPQPALLALDIPPTFIQSTGFRLLLLLCGAAILFAAYKLRIRYLSTLMQERLQERSRIARALHDTLLQSVQALLLSFDRHSRSLAEGSPERTRLDQTLDLAEQLLVEGRDQIMDLRVSTSPEALEQILDQYGKALAEHRPHSFALTVHGKPKQLCMEVQDQIYAIAREAVFNASRYADASRIEVELDYRGGAFTLRVRDDGKGFDQDVAASGQRPGHWGLVGMCERAASIGASFNIDSQPGSGTTITVSVPARSAY